MCDPIQFWPQRVKNYTSGIAHTYVQIHVTYEGEYPQDKLFITWKSIFWNLVIFESWEFFFFIVS